MHVLLDIVFCLFLLSTILYWVSLTTTKTSNLLKYSTTGLTIVSNCLLFGYLGQRWIDGGYFPLSNLYESLLFLTWCLTAVQLVSEFKTSSKIIGSIVAPLNLLLLTFSTSVLPLEMQKSTPLVPALQSNWLMLHVSMMMVSYSILILGSLMSTLVLILSIRSFQPTQEYITIRSDIAVPTLFDSKFKKFFAFNDDLRNDSIRAHYQTSGCESVTLVEEYSGFSSPRFSF
jgi:ABC-type transport system involved in cytochrome c biogenesis permease subunit